MMPLMLTGRQIDLIVETLGNQLEGLESRYEVLRDEVPFESTRQMRADIHNLNETVKLLDGAEWVLVMRP